MSNDAAATPVQLFMTDNCPYAERAWIAFLEKEADPAHPKLFDYQEVNFFNPDLPRTQDFLSVHKTVPAGRHGKEELRESLPIVYWVDEHYKNNPLQPSTPEGVQQMKDVIAKFTSGPFDLTAAIFGLIGIDADAPKEQLEAGRAKALAVFAEINKQLVASGGPYLLGEQFTIADIALIPFVDRAIEVIGHYRALVVPKTEEYAAVHAWRAAYSARPSHKIADADRLPRSVAVQPFKATKRKEYLIECFEGYANGVRDEFRAQLRHAPPGVKTFDLEKARAEKRAKLAAEGKSKD